MWCLVSRSQSAVVWPSIMLLAWPAEDSVDCLTGTGGFTWSVKLLTMISLSLVSTLTGGGGGLSSFISQLLGSFSTISGSVEEGGGGWAMLPLHRWFVSLGTCNETSDLCCPPASQMLTLGFSLASLELSAVLVPSSALFLPFTPPRARLMAFCLSFSFAWKCFGC